MVAEAANFLALNARLQVYAIQPGSVVHPACHTGSAEYGGGDCHLFTTLFIVARYMFQTAKQA